MQCVCVQIYRLHERRELADDRDLMLVVYLKKDARRSLNASLKVLLAVFSVRRKEQSILSPVNCWNLLLLQVKRESRDHATLSDLYLNNIIPRFAQISEDSGRLFKKVTASLLDLKFSCFRDVLKVCGGFVPAPQCPPTSSLIIQ